MTTDTAIDALLTEAAKTTEGLVRIEHLGRDLQKLAPLYANEATRPEAEAVLTTWASGGGLRKAMASHWLERAKGTVAKGAGGAAFTEVRPPAAAATNSPLDRSGRAAAGGNIHPALAKLRSFAKRRSA